MLPTLYLSLPHQAGAVVAVAVARVPALALGALVPVPAVVDDRGFVCEGETEPASFKLVVEREFCLANESNHLL